ncbi:MAG: ABA4-like family protein [Elstera sp.]
MLFSEPSAAALFGHASTITLTGWVILSLSIAFRLRKLRDWVPGLAIPLILSTIYTAIIGIHWWGAEGGFGSLAEVAQLFKSEWLLLAGWVHYLAYDLFIGTWIARDAETRQIPRWVLIPILPLAFLFGPAGLLLWILLRTTLQPAFQEKTP